MSKTAWIYILGTMLVALGAMVLSIQGFVLKPGQILVFLVLTICATLSQVYEVEGTFRNTYYPHSLFFLAGAVMLDPFLFSLVVIIPHSAEWIQKRLKKSPNLKAWYIQPFNMATHILAGYAVLLLHAIFTNFAWLDTIAAPILVVGLAFSYTVINHFFIGMALFLARGLSFYESGVMKLNFLIPDTTLACVGYIFVTMWNTSIYLTPLSLLPLVLMYQTLKIPQLTQDAQLDAKTGLLNAKYFNKIATSEFDEAVRSHNHISFLMADIDLMRNINNLYGHLAGDVVLAGVARTIRQVIPDQCHAGRFGGEEFAILLKNKDAESARIIGEQIRKAVEQIDFRVETHPDPIKVTMSLGLASFPADAKDLLDLTYRSDLAVYQAKKTGRNRVISYSELTNEEVRALQMKTKQTRFENNSEMELQLRKALDENQFRLFYQPKVDMRTGLICGMEALVRWQHPERGLISPIDFIPIAEENGLILPLGKWIFEEACRQVKMWNTFIRRHYPVTVSVNVSGVQFQREDVTEFVTTVLKETGCNPEWIEIEMTESVLMENTIYTVHTFKKLKEIGVKIAMDDFGIGYSSLSYLKNFPIDTLKIDRCFVTDLDKDEVNQALIQAIVSLSQKLNFKTIAEGIENEQERDKLIEVGCVYGQGYFYGPPITALAADSLLKEEKATKPQKHLTILRV